MDEEKEGVIWGNYFDYYFYENFSEELRQNKKKFLMALATLSCENPERSLKLQEVIFNMDKLEFTEILNLKGGLWVFFFFKSGANQEKLKILRLRQKNENDEF